MYSTCLSPQSPTLNRGSHTPLRTWGREGADAQEGLVSGIRSHRHQPRFPPVQRGKSLLALRLLAFPVCCLSNGWIPGEMTQACYQ